jgi:DNA-binding transcriptional regulator YiaG
MENRLCPCGKGTMALKSRKKGVTFRGVDMDVTCRTYVCPHCGLESGCVADVYEAQKSMAEVYRGEMGLLTGAEILTLREARHLSTEALAERLNVAPDTLQGWEEGTVQAPEMDLRLREVLKTGDTGDGT